MAPQDLDSFAHVPGCVAVLNEHTHKVVLLIRTVPGADINANHIGVLGFLGQVTFEITHKD